MCPALRPHLSFAALPFFNISRTIYWSSLKFVPPPEEEPSNPPQQPWAMDVGRVLAAVLVPVLALTLLALVLLLLQHRRRNYLSLLTGRALPPRHGPDVTLVATDIQNSTLLCKSKLHHLRRGRYIGTCTLERSSPCDPPCVSRA